MLVHYIINSLNSLAFNIAPIFYKVLFMSLSALSIGLIILLIRKSADDKISPKWKYVLWFIMLIALLIPFRAESKLAVFKNSSKIEDISFRSEYDDISYQAKMINQESKNQEEINAINDLEKEMYFKSLIFDVAIPIIWIIGLLSYLVFLTISKILMNINISKSCRKVPMLLNQDSGLDDKGKNSIKDIVKHTYRLEKILKKSKKSLNINRDIRIILQDYLPSPAIIGVFKPRILIPTYVLDLSDEHISYIIYHELGHYKRKDLYINYILLILMVIYWFNPLVIFLFRYIREDMEAANDSYIIDKLGREKSKEYAVSLVEVLAKANKISLGPKILCMVDNKKNITRRLRLLKLGEKFRSNKKLIAVISLILIGLLSMLFLSKDTRLSAYTNTRPHIMEIDIDGEMSVINLSEEESKEFVNILEYDKWQRDKSGMLKSLEIATMNVVVYGEGELIWIYEDVKGKLYFSVGERKEEVYTAPNEIFDNIYSFAKNTESYKFKNSLNKNSMNDNSGKKEADIDSENEKTTAFKGLELYVYKTDGITYFNLLPATNRNKTLAEVKGIASSIQPITLTSDLEDIINELKPYDEGLSLFISQLNEVDFTKEEMSEIGDKILESGFPKNSIMSIGLFKDDYDSEDTKVEKVETNQEEAYESEKKPDSDKLNYGLVALNNLCSHIEESRVLTAEEIEKVNLAFTQLIPDGQGELMINPLCLFLTSYYDEAKDMNLSEFLWYFGPRDKLNDSKNAKELEMLKELENFPFKNLNKLSETPVPISKVSAKEVDKALMAYMDIRLEDMRNTENVLYLKEYDSYYVYTSDFGAGFLNCIGGELDKDRLKLYGSSSDTKEGKIVLTLNRKGYNYYIESYERE